MSMMSTSRNVMQAPQTPGLQASIAAPGLAVPNPVSAQAQQFGQMVQAMGLIGNLANQAGSMADRETYMRERQQNIFDSQFKGQASLDARAMLPAWIDRIRNGEVKLPDGADPEEWVRAQVDAVLEDAPEAYATAFRSTAVPAGVNAIVAQQRAFQDQQKADALTAQSAAAWDAESTKEIRRIVHEAKQIDPNMTDREAMSVIAVPMLKSAARTGDRARFAMVAEMVAKHYPAMVDEERQTLEHQIRVKENQAWNERQREYYQWTHATTRSMINRVGPDGEPLPPSWDEIEGNVIERGRAAGMGEVEISSALGSARSMLNQYEADKHAANNELIRDNETKLRRMIEQDEDPNLVTSRINEVRPILGEDRADRWLSLVDESQEAKGKSIRRQQIENTRQDIMLGAFETPQHLQDHLQERMQLPADHPMHVTAPQVRELMGYWTQAQDENRAMQDVVRRLQGESVLWHSSAHTQAGLQVARDAGAIDENNRIANPDQFAWIMSPAQVLDGETSQLLLSGLSDPSATPDQMVNSALAIRALGTSTIANQLYANASESQRHMIDAINNMSAETIGTEQGIKAMQLARSAPRESIVKSSAIISRIIEEEGIDLQRENASILEAVRREHEHVGYRWFSVFEPTTQMMDERIPRLMDDWFKMGLRMTEGRAMTRADRLQYARDHAQTEMRRSLAWISYNGNTYPALVDDMAGVGGVMPPEFRWSNGSEAEFKRDLEKANIPPDQVAGIRATAVRQEDGNMAIVYIPSNSYGNDILIPGKDDQVFAYLASTEQQRMNREAVERMEAIRDGYRDMDRANPRQGLINARNITLTDEQRRQAQEAGTRTAPPQQPTAPRSSPSQFFGGITE